jgi:hypothetical protein
MILKNPEFCFVGFWGDLDVKLTAFCHIVKKTPYFS